MFVLLFYLQLIELGFGGLLERLVELRDFVGVGGRQGCDFTIFQAFIAALRPCRQLQQKLKKKQLQKRYLQSYNF